MSICCPSAYPDRLLCNTKCCTINRMGSIPKWLNSTDRIAGNHEAVQKRCTEQMKTEYQDRISKLFPPFSRMLNHIIVKEIPSGKILLFEGTIAENLFLIINGCLRAFYIKECGTEITEQFFIEGQGVVSFESASTGTPSRLNIDAIENSTIGIIPWKNVENTLAENSEYKEYFTTFLKSRLIFYMNQYASFILDNPENRYAKFLHEHPELASRIPQQYIASYLGITPVSLSRIRTRLKNRINNC